MPILPLLHPASSFCSFSLGAASGWARMARRCRGMTESNPGRRCRTQSSAAGLGSEVGVGRAGRGLPVARGVWPAAPPGRVSWESVPRPEWGRALQSIVSLVRKETWVIRRKPVWLFFIRMFPDSQIFAKLEGSWVVGQCQGFRVGAIFFFSTY